MVIELREVSMQPRPHLLGRVTGAARRTPRRDEIGRRPPIDDGRALITTRGNPFRGIAQHFIQRADGQDGVNTPLTLRLPLDMLE
jgi:hypothetical protein